MRFRICGLAVLLFLLCPAGFSQDGRSQDGPIYVPCLDTWAINSNVVLLAKIVEVCSPSHCKSGNTVALKVERYLKGGQGAALTLQIDAPVETLKDWKRRKAILLLFDGLNVDPLSSLKPPAEAMDLSDPQLAVVTARMEVLHDPDAILAAVGSAIERHPGVGHVSTFPEMLLNEALGLNDGFLRWRWCRSMPISRAGRVRCCLVRRIRPSTRRSVRRRCGRWRSFRRTRTRACSKRC